MGKAVPKPRKRINSRTKGKSGELEFSKVLIAAGFKARRGQQYAGGTDSPDVICEDLPTVHFEVKRTQSLQIYKAYEQAVKDCKGKKLPLVVHRKNGKPWLAVIGMEDMIAYLLYREAALI